MSTSNKQIPDDEIDLGALGNKLYAIVSYPFALLLSNLRTTIAFVAAAVLVAVAVKFVVPKTYSASFIIRPSDIKDKLHLRVLEDIPLMLKKVNQDILAETLNMPPADAAKITNISISNSSTGKTLVDSLNCTQITITSTDYNQFMPVQNGIIAYLEHNPYYLKLRKLQETQIDITLQQIEKDATQLDSLKKLQIKNYDKQGTAGQSPILLNELANPVAAYTLGYERNTQKINMLGQRMFINRFEVIKSCIVNKQPVFPPRIMVTCLYLIPASLLLCFVFLLIKNAIVKGRSSKPL